MSSIQLPPDLLVCSSLSSKRTSEVAWIGLNWGIVAQASAPLAQQGWSWINAARHKSRPSDVNVLEVCESVNLSLIYTSPVEHPVPLNDKGEACPWQPWNDLDPYPLVGTFIIYTKTTIYNWLRNGFFYLLTSRKIVKLYCKGQENNKKRLHLIAAKWTTERQRAAQ